MKMTVTPNGARVKELREEKGWQQIELFEKSKVSVTSIQTIEKGGNVKKITLTKVAVALGVDTRSLINVDVSQAFKTINALPISFEHHMERAKSNYSGRKWLTDRYDAFSNDLDVAKSGKHAGGLFVVIAPPGTGKSTWLANLIEDTHIFLHFFFSKGEGLVTHDQLIQCIAAQADTTEILSHAHGYGDRLSNLLRQLDLDRPTVLAIDGLDQSEGGDLIGRNAAFLPDEPIPNLIIVATARESARIPLWTENRSVIRLNEYWAESIDDVRQFVEDQVKPGNKDFARRVAESARGNFLYARHVLLEGKRLGYRKYDFNNLPTDLAQYYSDHWDHMVQVSEHFEDEHEAVLKHIVMSTHPISAAELSELTGLSRSIVRKVIHGWADYLYEQETESGTSGYTIYHSSFSDFLKHECGMVT